MNRSSAATGPKLFIYRVVTQKEYEEYKKPKLVEQKKPKLNFPGITKQKKQTAKNIIAVIDKLGIKYNDDGVLVQSPLTEKYLLDWLHDSIIPYISFAVEGKARPDNWELFGKFLLKQKQPLQQLSSKARREIKKIKQNESSS